jgi:hypothetical protein
MANALGSVGLDALSATAVAGYRAIRREVTRRLTDNPTDSSLAAIDDELDDAIAILGQTATTALGSINLAAKALLSRPNMFRHPVPAAWLATETTQQLLKSAAHHLIRGEPIAEDAAAAISHYELFCAHDDDPPPPGGGEAFAVALDYIQRSLRRGMSFGDRLLLNAIGGLSDQIALGQERNDFSGVDEILDARLEEETRRIQQRRFFVSADTAKASLDLAQAIREGRLKQASPRAKATALARCARWISISDQAMAEDYLEQAAAMASPPPVDVRIAQAFLQSASDIGGALANLAIDTVPAEATAALQIMRRAGSATDALDWVRRAGLDLTNFDADGRYVLIATVMEADDWPAAINMIGRLSDADYSDAPVLLWTSAILLVAGPLRSDLRRAILQDVPAHPAAFPLPEDKLSIDRRRLARALLQSAAKRCHDLDLPTEVAAADRYALWLDLRDPDRHDDALERLRSLVSDSKTALGALPLGLAFGLPIERDEAERLIERHLARKPLGDRDAVAAILALIFDRVRQDPSRAADLLVRHRALLAGHLETTTFLGLEIQILLDADRRDDARARLASIAPDTLETALFDYLKAAVAGDEEGPSIEQLEALYRDGEPTHVLVKLVRHYRALGFSDRYLELARQLVLTGRNSRDAVETIEFLITQGQEAEAARLIDDVADLTEHSLDLLSQSAWLNVRAGRLDAAEQALAKLESHRDDPNDRKLRYHLLVTSGRWPELHAFVEQQWAARSSRSVAELAELATLAAHINSARLRDIIMAAVEQSPDDPRVLVAAYGAATFGGLEEDIGETGQWITRAAEMSDEDGPIQQKSLADLIAYQPDWEEQVDTTYRQLAASEIPLSAAATMLRRSWLELQLLPLVSNSEASDVRDRALVPLFSGKRRPIVAMADDLGTKVAIDRTALITLAALGLLKPLIGAVGQLWISNATLRELFEDLHRVRFHQPSRIHFASRLVALLGRNKVEAFQPTTIPDAVLANDIGMSLAALLTEAAAHGTGQAIVIHPFPITRAGSLLRDPVDLSAYQAHLSSCLAVVDTLSRAARLTRSQEARARAYLELHDRHWPDEPTIERGATLFLSDLAVDYFRYTGLLDKIEAAGLKVVVSSTEIAQAQALLEYQSRSDRVIGVVEDIRRALAEGLASGRVMLDRARPVEDDLDPTIATGWLAEQAPVLICDDRFINRFDHFDHRGGKTRILTSLEAMESLKDQGRIAPHVVADIRTRLRGAGAMLVPISSDELVDFLDQSEIVDGALRETAELRAIRESVRLTQLRGWFEPIVDGNWLVDSHNTIVEAIIDQWRDEVPDDIARARSNWFMGLLDIGDWSDVVHKTITDFMADNGALLLMSKMVVAAMPLQGEAAARFADWLQEHYLNPFWYEGPRLKPRFLKHMRGLIRSLAADPNLDETLPHADTRLRGRAALQCFSNALQLELAEDEEFRTEFGIDVNSTIEIGSDDARFNRRTFFAAVTALYKRPRAVQTIDDIDGQAWRVSTNPNDNLWPITVTRDKHSFRIRGIFPLHPDPTVRLAMLDEEALTSLIAPAEMVGWRDRLAAAPLRDVEIEALTADLNDAPAPVAEAIAASVTAGQASIGLLVSESRRYYERLTGRGPAETVDDYVQGVLPRFAETVLGQDLLQGAKQLLLLASHPAILTVGPLNWIDPETLLALGAWVADEGDLLSKIGFVEIAMGRSAAEPALVPIIEGIIRQIETLDPQEDGGRLEYFAALVMFADGELSRNAVLADVPPFRRRIAAFAQAALIERQTSGRVDSAHFARFCIDQRGWRFFVQNLVDLRVEPRWRPDYIAPDQLRNELIGRIINRAGSLNSDQIDARLMALILDEKTGLRARMAFPMIFWPGPIEGAPPTLIHEPDPSITEMIETALSDEASSTAGLNGLVNASAMFTLPDRLLAQAVERIRASGPRLFVDLEADSAQAYLVGLAYVAAAHRKIDLADQIQALARRRRLLARGALRIDDEMQLALIIAAARAEPELWRKVLGGWLQELAVSVQTEGEAQSLNNWVEMLCSIDPVLRTQTGRAAAAIRLILQR